MPSHQPSAQSSYQPSSPSTRTGPPGPSSDQRLHQPEPAVADVLRRLGAGPAVLAAFAALAAPGADQHAGRVVRAERSGALVSTPDGEVPTPYADVAVGDWVTLRDGAVAGVLPRSSTIVRAESGGRSAPQVLAANVDAVLVCTPRTAAPSGRRIERLLALAWASGATAVLVATKADLSDADLEPLRRLAPGVAVVPTRPGDVHGLAPYLGPGRTVALLGASGVGKSTLANALLGQDTLATRALRADGKGRHTTSWRQLVVLPGGGALIDTPGLRGVGLAPADADGVSAAFADVAELAADCRFRDCSHSGEPDCAVASAVGAGLIDAARVASHRKLQRELEWQAAKSDARVRAERNRRWRAVMQEQRAHYRR